MPVQKKSGNLLNAPHFIGLVGRVFANGPGKWGSITGRVIPKTQKIVLDATLFNIQHYKVQIKGKGKEYCPPLHLGVVVNEKGASQLPSTIVTNFTLLT